MFKDITLSKQLMLEYEKFKDNYINECEILN